MSSETPDTPTVPESDQALLNVFRDVYGAGQEFEYGNCTLHRLDTADPFWMVTHTGRYVDIIHAGRFPAVSGLADHLERGCGALHDAEEVFQTEDREPVAEEAGE